MKLILTLLLLAASQLGAATIHFDSGWTDHDSAGLGLGFVVLDVDGVKVHAVDYTFNFWSSPGQTWEANLTSLPDLPLYYESEPLAFLRNSAVTWIAEDFLGATTHAQRRDYQYAMYAIFNPLTAPHTVGSLAEVASAYTRATSGYADGWVFVNSVEGSKELKQGFLYNTPEPGTWLLMLAGVGLLAVRRLQRA